MLSDHVITLMGRTITITAHGVFMVGISIIIRAGVLDRFIFQPKTDCRGEEIRPR